MQDSGVAGAGLRVTGGWPRPAAIGGAFAATVTAMLVLRRIALRVDLVDHPGGRKLHEGRVPLVGGLAMVVGLAVGLAVAGAAVGPLQQYLYSAVLLTAVGALDDNFSLSPGLRLLAQLAAVLPMFFGVGIRLQSLGDLVGIGPLDVSGVSLAVTMFITVAAINAFNLLDGLDGLAGGVALIALLVYLLLQPGTIDPGSALLALVLLACLAGFLAFNVPVPWDNSGYKCFMGDAGSTMVGFSLAWLLIRASQGVHPLLAPVTALWIVFVPAVDLLWTVLRRMLRRQSMLRADGEHLHHLLRRAGLAPAAALGVLLGLTLLGGLVGLLLEKAAVPAWGSFAIWWASGIAMVAATTRGARR
jgi:UDP-GlcNAc:undecaprenyl-phosphate GlcNAc-1-phosphate transferase